MKFKDSLLVQKIAYMLIIMFWYCVGRGIPLMGVDVATYRDQAVDATQAFEQAISGDANQISIFALGLIGYMMSLFMVQIIMSLRSKEAKAATSSSRVNRISMVVAMIIVMIQAIVRIDSIIYVPEAEGYLFWYKAMDFIEMVTGVMIIIWFVRRNCTYGIGTMTPIILVNMVSSLQKIIINHWGNDLWLPLGISGVAMVVALIMENAEFRIPVQRISIQNVYKDKNYMAFKLNPVGTMPLMFATLMFMLPQLVIKGLLMIWPDSERLAWWKTNMVLNHPLGAVTYIIILYLLTFLMAFIMFSPKDQTENLLKSGDSIVNLHAGKPTRRFLRSTLLKLCFISATVMSAFMSIPLYMQTQGLIDQQLTMLPATAMMVTGLWCNLFREGSVIRKYDLYQPFI